MKPRWFKESAGGEALGIVSADESAVIAVVYRPKYAETIRLAPEMLRLVTKVARLNPKAGEIGAGMLAQLVEEANAIIKRVEVE